MAKAMPVFARISANRIHAGGSYPPAAAEMDFYKGMQQWNGNDLLYQLAAAFCVVNL